jgi:hypothetical protein
MRHSPWRVWIRSTRAPSTARQAKPRGLASVLPIGRARRIGSERYGTTGAGKPSALASSSTTSEGIGVRCPEKL